MPLQSLDTLHLDSIRQITIITFHYMPVMYCYNLAGRMIQVDNIYPDQARSPNRPKRFSMTPVGA